MKTRNYILIIILLICGSLTTFGQPIDSAPFKAGAAKIDITPAPDSIPQKIFTRGIRDHIYVRAVVVDNGISSAALLSLDIDETGKDATEKWIPLIEKATGIPAQNIIIVATHTHSSIQLPRGNVDNIDPRVAAFAANFEKSVVEVVRQAKEKLQPARIGYKTGAAYLNVNRNAIDPLTRQWTQGPNYDGPSDKEVGVVTFESLEGIPIAVYYNFGMHANSMYMSGILSASSPGETSKYIENYYHNTVIALWSSSASGDQNPRYLQPMSDIEKIKSDLALSSGRAKNSEDANKIAGFEGAVNDIVQIDPNLYERQSQMISSIGQFLGEEVLRVMKYTLRYKSEIQIFSSDTTVTCPGRTRTSFNREGSPATYTDGNPANIGLQLLVIGDIAICAMGGDPFSKIAMDLKEEAPFNYTLMVVHANGLGGGYIPSDDAYGMNTFQVLGSRIQPGYAERSIINGFLDLMDKAR